MGGWLGLTTGPPESWKMGVEWGAGIDIGGREGIEKAGIPAKASGGGEACEVSHKSDDFTL